jgi:hypothetical protein
MWAEKVLFTSGANHADSIYFIEEAMPIPGQRQAESTDNATG